MQIPKSWTRDKIGSVFFTTSGGTPSRKNPNYYIGSIPWVKSGELDKGLIIQTEEYISPEAIQNSSAKVFPKGTLLIALYGATIGKLGFLGVDAATNQAICGIFDNGNFSLQYTKHFLFHNRNKLIEQGAGGAQPNISQTILKELSIAIPPLAEQHRIVAKIEELFSSLDKAIESITTAKQQLKVYRQAVLKWAFEGRLTNDNVVDGELPKGWKELQISDIAEKITDGEHFRPQTQNEGIPFLSAKDVRDNGVSFDAPLYISSETARKALQRCNPEKGDVLIVSRGATVGRMCIVNTDRTFCLLGSVILIKVKQLYSSKFITYILKSPFANQKMISVSGATAQQAIYLRDIKQIFIPVPGSIDEQERIVEEIESRLSVCDKIEEGIENSLLQAEALKQSILKKAFEGRLVPQDPSDEPASKLIERIKAEREKNIKGKKNAKVRV